MQRTTGPVNKLGPLPDYEYKIIIKYCTLNDLFNFLTILDFQFALDTKFSYKSFLVSVVNTKVIVLRTRHFQKTLTVLMYRLGESFKQI